MKSLKIVGIIITILFTFCMPLVTYSATIDPELYNPANNQIKEGDYSQVAGIAKTIITVITSVGLVVAVVGIMAIGIKYLVGSAEQRADYKKTMIPYLVGCVLIFAITQIVSLIYNLTSKVNV